MKIDTNYLTSFTKENLNKATTAYEIKNILSFYFKTADYSNIPIEMQWRTIGIIFDQYRKGEL